MAKAYRCDNCGCYCDGEMNISTENDPEALGYKVGLIIGKRPEPKEEPDRPDDGDILGSLLRRGPRIADEWVKADLCHPCKRLILLEALRTLEWAPVSA